MGEGLKQTAAEFVVFGWSGTDFKSFYQAIDEGLGTWTQLAYAVGAENGCPRVTTNIKKLMDQLNIDQETAAQKYIEEHLPQNQEWSRILGLTLERNRPLFTDIAHSFEPVNEGETYDAECVPLSYSEDHILTGLSQDRPYVIVKRILHEIDKHQGLRDPIDRIIESCVADSTTLDELHSNILNRLSI
jgi:hypothetical protein